MSQHQSERRGWVPAAAGPLVRCVAAVALSVVGAGAVLAAQAGAAAPP